MIIAVPSFTARSQHVTAQPGRQTTGRHALTRSAVAELFAAELYGQHRI